MRHKEQEMEALREEAMHMWKLVISQLEKAKNCFLESNIELAHEIVSREKRVDAFELKMDSNCENYIALYNPVAIDLRLALSLIKISNTLERIGDFADGVARHVIDEDCNDVDPALIEKLQLEHMFDMLIGMLTDSFVAFDSENTKISGRILARDEEVDAIYDHSMDVLADYVQTEPKFAKCALKLHLLTRKLERIGDHCCNIVEEIVFYVDARVLKHSDKNSN